MLQNNFDDTTVRTGMAQAIYTVIVMRCVCTATAPKLIYITLWGDICCNSARCGNDAKWPIGAHAVDELPWIQGDCDGGVGALGGSKT